MITGHCGRPASFLPGGRLIAMIEIDGSMQSGSGTVLRYAFALAALQGEPCASVASTLIPVPQ
jgi:hypothetical protein